MAGRYLVELADWLRAAGLDVVEFEGWRTRARSSGGYLDGRPWAIMWHHTASATTLANDAHYCNHVAPARPVTNLIVDRSGRVGICAAGATNTNGTGRATPMSRGIVPANSMNSYAVSIEIASRGTGETYPVDQIEACFAVSLTLAARLGLRPDDVCTHQHYTDRKIDPAGPVAGAWHPRPINSAGTWSVEDLRAECRRRSTVAPDIEPEPAEPEQPTEPPTEEDDDEMSKPSVLLKASNSKGDAAKATFWWNGTMIGQILSTDAMNLGLVLGYYVGDGDNQPLRNLTQYQIQRLIDTQWHGGKVPAGFNQPERWADSGTA